jgi:type IV pilus biogenesis/stability protein PilW
MKNRWPLSICSFWLIVSFLVFYACATTSKTELLKKAEAHYKLGVSYMLKDQLNDAFIEFQKAIKLVPEHKESYNSLGYISTRFKKYEEAISYYKKALSIDPRYSEAMNNLGVTYSEMGKWDEAIRYFKKALENPFYQTPERAYTNMAFAYYKKGDYRHAEEAVNEALTRFPDFPMARYIHGLLNVAYGDDVSAIEDFKKVLSVSPDYINAHYEIAHAYVRIGERDKALEHFRVVAEKGKDKKMVKESKEYIMLLEK